MGRQVPPIWADMLCFYLDAEPRAVWVLSDLLTEAGAEPLRPGSDDKRVRRVLGILPPPLAHAIACDFAEHVLEGWWGGVISAKRQWLRGEIDDETLRNTPIADHGVRHFLLRDVRSTSPAPSVAQSAAKHALHLAHPDGRAEVEWQRRHLKEVLERG